MVSMVFSMKSKITYTKTLTIDITSFFNRPKYFRETIWTHQFSSEHMMICMPHSMQLVLLHAAGQPFPSPTTLSAITWLRELVSGTLLNKPSLKIIISCKKSVGKPKVKPKQFLFMCHSINSTYKQVKAIWLIYRQGFGRRNGIQECLTIFHTP